MPARLTPLIDSEPFPEAQYHELPTANSANSGDKNDLVSIARYRTNHRKEQSRVSRRSFAVGLGLIATTSFISCALIASRRGRDVSDFDYRLGWEQGGSVMEYSADSWRRSFESFYVTNDKQQDYSFGTEEYDRRFDIYKRNLRLIEAHNSKLRKSSSKLHDYQEENEEDLSYTMAPNQFADMTFDEFRGRHLTGSPAASLGSMGSASRVSGNLLALSANLSLPTYVNWQDKGCVTPVKDQAKCGSCWAFSSTGAIEGAYCAQTGRLISLSEQELVDCAGPEGEHGCNGGVMDKAFQYVIDHHGICQEDDYPYTALQGTCRHNCTRKAQISGFMNIPRMNTKALKAALAFYGPISAGIEADRSAFQFYHSGVFTLPCGKHLNHAILVTGYGMDPATGQTYWIVKNSWGSKWGDRGYVKLGRKGHHGGKAGECGILLSPVAPLMGPID